MDNKKKQHFILTKFNLRQHLEYDSSLDNNSDSWLNERFEYFLKFCVPSIVGQSNNDFIWLVFFDSAIPHNFRAIIENISEICPNFKPIFSNCAINDIVFFKTQISKFLLPDVNILITTRLDSDDALNPLYVEIIHNHLLNNGIDFFINFQYGIQYDLNNKVIFQIGQISNAFITRIEFILHGQFKSVLQLSSHEDAAKKYFCLNLKNKGMWLQIIHGNNISNKISVKSIPNISIKNLSGFSRLRLVNNPYRNVLFYLNVFFRRILNV